MPQNVNKELAHIFEEMGIIYEIRDERFRQRAYHRASLTMRNLSSNVKKVYEESGVKGLKKLPGIGEGLASKIEEYIKTGKVKEHQKLKGSIPVKLEELTAVEGVGPKAVKKLYDQLDIKDIKDLEEAAKKGKIRELEGFGKKKEENILQGIGFVKSNGGRKRLGDVLPYAQNLLEELRGLPGVVKADLAGSIRRKKETIGDVDVLVTAKDNQKVLDYIAELPGVAKVLASGETKVSVHMVQGFDPVRGREGSQRASTSNGIDIDIRAVEEESYGAALQYFTGSKEHNVKVRQIAIGKGYKLNEYGLFPAKGGSASGGKGKTNHAKGTDECLIYKKLDMACPPPEMRTDTGEVEAAQKNKLPNLIEYGSIKGDLQIQTKWTDGKNTIEEYAKAAKDLGLEYIAITDHTKALAMTGGLDEKRLLEHQKEVREVDKKIKGIKVLSGAEVNIMKDGSLDIDDETLEQLDVVGVSIHSYFSLGRKEQTKRVIKAIQNPHADIFFHPTGRRINRRAPIDVDMAEVIKAAKETGTVLEINAHPERLDLKDEHIRMAVEAGVKMCINTDAHSVDGLHYLDYGVAQARRGWATAGDVINTLPVDQFLKSLK